MINKVKFQRNINLTNQIVILDGLTGTGKTMFAPLINSFNKIQNSRFEYMIEYLCISAKKNKIQEDASISLLNLLADIKYYDGAISREVNFRPTDLSSVFSGGNWSKYILQLFLPDGEFAGKRLQKENPILFFVTHQILSCIEPAFNAFGERLKLVQMVRHPLYLVDHWESYIEMHGNNSRDFTIWIDYMGQSLPWFTEGWEEKFITSNSFDKSIYSIEFLLQKVFSSFNKDENSKFYHSIMYIPFEDFVLNPDSYLEKLETFLNTTSTKKTKKILKTQRVPRESINAGPQKNIYKRYALKKFNKKESHKTDYENRLEIIKSKCSPEAFNTLLNLNNEYEKNFGIWF